MIHLKRKKINFINSCAVDIIRTAYYIRGLELMKLIFAVFRKSTSGFRFRNGTRVRRWITMCMPNFDAISQSTAKIKLLPVLEKGRPPYWNCTSGFDFDLFIVIGKSLYTSLSNFVVVGQSSANL